MVDAEGEVALFEERLLSCPLCIDAAEEAAQLRAAITKGNFELDCDT
jgi:hypothetical protein